MFFTRTKQPTVDVQLQQMNALHKSCEQELRAIKQHTAFISFTPEGYVLDANPLFLEATGYRLSAGRNHWSASPDVLSTTICRY